MSENDAFMPSQAKTETFPALPLLRESTLFP